MRTMGARESNNIEDRRGGGGMLVGGGVGTLVLAVVVYLLGGDPSTVLDSEPMPSPREGQVAPPPDRAHEDELTRFVRVVLADTEDVWNAELPRQTAVPYRNPKLVLFSGAVQSACGSASAATGPFYCPGDEKLYIDLGFYTELRTRFQAPGDFAQAYVIAHEVGHHVQHLLGIHGERGGQIQANQRSVRLELQADYFAGVWAHHAQRMRNVLEPGDIEEALGAASAVGDDRIQRQARGYVIPDSFTHGTSAQRMAWFKKGFRTGDVRQGDTFTLPDP
jgi:predicted metalloprotease